eukprot:INCI727.3.p1 GENE.INCI727.3~~INCI727.3.p1  ORF type:complete len:476 (+),score=131.11 INCI727.3:100-1527(+)
MALRALLEDASLGKLSATVEDFEDAGLDSAAKIAALDASALCEELGGGLLKKAQARKIIKLAASQLKEEQPLAQGKQTGKKHHAKHPNSAPTSAGAAPAAEEKKGKKKGKKKAGKGGRVTSLSAKFAGLNIPVGNAARKKPSAQASSSAGAGSGVRTLAGGKASEDVASAVLGRPTVASRRRPSRRPRANFGAATSVAAPATYRRAPGSAIAKQQGKTATKPAPKAVAQAAAKSASKAAPNASEALRQLLANPELGSLNIKASSFTAVGIQSLGDVVKLNAGALCEVVGSSSLKKAQARKMIKLANVALARQDSAATPAPTPAPESAVSKASALASRSVADEVARMLKSHSEALGKLEVSVADFVSAGLLTLDSIVPLSVASLCDKLGGSKLKKAQARKILKLAKEEMKAVKPKQPTQSNKESAHGEQAAQQNREKNAAEAEKKAVAKKAAEAKRAADAEKAAAAKEAGDAKKGC